jgi:hypothetical protein
MVRFPFNALFNLVTKTMFTIFASRFIRDIVLCFFLAMFFSGFHSKVNAGLLENGEKHLLLFSFWKSLYRISIILSLTIW